MIKLLRSNLKRILTSKTFWICSATYLLYGVIVLLVDYFDGFDAMSFPSYNFALSGSPLTGVIISIFSSAIVGADFNGKTIRNKLVVGHSKRKIYLSNALALSICAIALNLIYLCITLPFTPATALLQLLGAFFHEDVTATIAEIIALTIFYNILSAVFFVSVYTLIVMLLKNTVLSLIIGIALNLLATYVTFILASIDVFGPLYFYPSGLNALIANGELLGYSDDKPLLLALFTAIIIAMIAIVTVIGAKIFDKSNLK